MVNKNALLITDLAEPSFHTEEVLTRLRKGFFLCSLITKRPAGLLPILEGLAPEDLRRVTVQVTVTGMGGTPWEPGVQKPEEALGDIALLHKYLTSEQVSLRYDPIIPDVNDDPDDIRAVLSSAKDMGVSAVTTSVLDVYPHVRQRILLSGDVVASLPPSFQYARHLRYSILSSFVGIAASLGMKVRICCEDGYEGYQAAGCDWVLESMERVLGRHVVPDDLPKGTQRKSCGCPKFEQILPYDPRCGCRCLYCYVKRQGEFD